MSHMMKTHKLKLFYFQKEVQHWAKKLWKDIFLGNLSLNEGKNFVGLPVLNSRIWCRHVKTKNYGLLFADGRRNDGETTLCLSISSVNFSKIIN